MGGRIGEMWGTPKLNIMGSEDFDLENTSPD
jgi:hypothetical protein